MCSTETKIGQVLFIYFISIQCHVSAISLHILCRRVQEGQEIRRWIPWRRTSGWTGCGWPRFSPGLAGCRSRGCLEARHTAAVWKAPARSGLTCSLGSSPLCRTPSLEHQETVKKGDKRHFFIIDNCNICNLQKYKNSFHSRTKSKREKKCDRNI